MKIGESKIRMKCKVIFIHVADNGVGSWNVRSECETAHFSVPRMFSNISNQVNASGRAE